MSLELMSPGGHGPSTVHLLISLPITEPAPRGRSLSLVNGTLPEQGPFTLCHNFQKAQDSLVPILHGGMVARRYS